MKIIAAAAFGAAALLIGANASAQTIDGAPVQVLPDVSSAASTPTPICTDRPTKANVVCTVPRGDVQIEADAINWTRFSSGRIDTETILYTNPTAKYGLGTTTDIELNLASYETVHTHGQGTSDTLGGVGDLYVRLKQQLTAPGAKTQVALIPYVKAPSARFGIGNKRWEGGVILPVIFTLPSGYTLNLGPEVDILADGDGHGNHANLVSLVNLSHAVGKKGTV